MWTSETCALFIRGVKITSHMKERLIQQLLDGDLQKYLMIKRILHAGSSIASIGGATARRLKAYHAHDKRPWPRHITTSGTPGRNPNNIMAVRNLVACVEMHTKIGDTL
jgi:hypothetical protein